MITDFLKTDIPKEELAAALKIVRAFKQCESGREWVFIPFIAWTKLEQLEELLAHLVEGAPLKDDTLEYIKSQENT